MRRMDFIQHRQVFAYRGPEVAFIVPSGDLGALDDVMSGCCGFWNGANSLIVPVDSDGEISIGYLDRLIGVRPIEHSLIHPNLPKEMLEGFRSDGRLGQVSRWGDHSIEKRIIHPLNLQPSFQRFTDTPPPELLEPTSSDDGLARVIRCTWGTIEDEGRDEYKKAFTLREASAERVHSAILHSQLKALSPLSQSTYQIMPYRQVSATGIRQLFVFCNRDFDELVFFWNVRARSANFGPGPGFVGLDHEAFHHTQDVVDVAEWLTSDRVGLVIKPDVLVSVHPSKKDLVAASLEKLGFRAAPEDAPFQESWPNPPEGRELPEYMTVTSPILGHALRRGLKGEQLAIVKMGDNTISLEQPEFKFRHGGHIVVELVDLPLPLPVSISSAKRVISNSTPTPGGLRFVTLGNSRLNLQFHLPSNEELLTDYLRDRGIKGELSPDGRYARAVIGRIDNDLSRLDALATDTSLRVLEALTPLSRKKLVDKMKIELGDQGSTKEAVEKAVTHTLREHSLHLELRALTLGDIASQTTITQKKIAPVLSELVAAGFVRRGFSLRCPECGYKDFFRLSALDEFVECAACRRSFLLPPFEEDERTSRRVYFRLDGLTARAMDQDLLPVLLTLRKLWSENALGQYEAFWPGLNVQGDAFGTSEIDILVGQGTTVLAYECKKHGGSLDVSQARKLIDIADRLDAQVGFAALEGDYSNEVASLANEHGARLLNRGDLLI